MINFTNIYSIVSKIPQGRVMTYKQIAILSGLKNPRNVGLALHRNTDGDKVPCHRVIRSDGKLASGYAFGGMRKQKEKLEKEGVGFINDRVNLRKFLLS